MGTMVIDVHKCVICILVGAQAFEPLRANDTGTVAVRMSEVVERERGRHP